VLYQHLPAVKEQSEWGEIPPGKVDETTKKERRKIGYEGGRRVSKSKVRKTVDLKYKDSSSKRGKKRGGDCLKKGKVVEIQTGKGNFGLHKRRQGEEIEKIAHWLGEEA